MGHLMPEHRRKRRVVLRERQDTGVDHDFPPGRQNALACSLATTLTCQSKPGADGPTTSINRFATRTT
jgi:hypothetical protein